MSYEVSFLHVLREINRSNKFIQPFQVDVLGCPQRDSKQQVKFFAYRSASSKTTNCKRDFQNFSRGTKRFLNAVNFHGHEL